jgi:hypothetical protein
LLRSGIFAQSRRPLGAVEQSTMPYNRLFSDLRHSNKFLRKWSV